MIMRQISSRRAIGIALASAALLWATGVSAQSGPFQGLAGAWSGNGTVELNDNSKERIRCRATYAVRGDADAMNLTLRCASDSYNFEIKSDLVANGGAISGNWSEVSRGVSGPLEGRASRGRFNVSINSPSFNARVELVTRGSKQTAMIVSDSTLKVARITLTRG